MTRRLMLTRQPPALLTARRSQYTKICFQNRQMRRLHPAFPAQTPAAAYPAHPRTRDSSTASAVYRSAPMEAANSGVTGAPPTATFTESRKPA